MDDKPAAQQLTIRQLQIFCMVAQTGSLTRAAKQLDVRQPSISQQLSRMEHAVGGKLIRYVNAELRLTAAGQYLLEHATGILGAVDRANAGLAQFFEGSRGRLVVGALPSAIRNLLMPACAELAETLPGYTLDIVEVTPQEARTQLQGRLIDAAVVSSYAVGERSGLRALPLTSDRQLLAVPNRLPDLRAVRDLASDLTGEHLAALRRTVRYAFGSDHTTRVNAWYDRLVPGAEMAVRCRSYESALSFVEGGVATALVPELATRQGNRALFDVTLYEVPLPSRQTLFLTHDQYATLPAVRALTEALRTAAAAIEPLACVRPEPMFAARTLDDNALRQSDRPNVAP